MTFLASKNHIRKTVLVQTLSCDIKLPCWCNNAWGNYFPPQLTVWGCSLSTKGHMNFLAKTVVPDQTCTLLRSSDLGRHISHIAHNSSSGNSTGSTEWRTGDSNMWLHCPEGLTSDWEMSFDTSSLEPPSSQKLNTVWRESCGLPTALSAYPNYIQSCCLIPPFSLHPTDSFLSSSHETVNVIFYK